MKLNNILKHIEVLEVAGNPDIEIQSLEFDSRNVQPGQVFVAMQGTQVDGHQFIPSVIEKGAVAVVCEVLPENLSAQVCYVKVKDTAEALALLAAAYYDNPSSKLKLVGITGTNGKTTTVTLLYNLFRAMGYKVGLLSTVANYIEGKELEAMHTTPDALELNRLLAQMVEVGCGYCFMEVSSHAVVQKRVTGLDFSGAIFSNITHDHLDYHKTFDEYIRAKKGFFDALPAHAFALVNIDDRNGRVMVQNTKAKVKTYALKTMADFRCRILDSSFDGMQLMVDSEEVWTRLIGEFNAYNFLAVYATAVLLGADKHEALRLLSGLESVSGRFQYVKSANGIIGIVDYAHTPDALRNVLSTINQIRRDDERLITVVGCGGNRDKTKRPIMAQIAVDESDLAILTSDNPRFEDPEAIIADMRAGLDANQLRQALSIVNRHEAIRTAVMMSKPGDIILVAGKGHENYQIVNGVKSHFDDKEELTTAFNN